MKKLFSFNEDRSGTLIDSVSKKAGTLTVGDGGFRKTEKGQALLCDGALTRITGIPITEANTCDVVTVFMWTSKLLNWTNTIISKGYQHFELSISTTKLDGYVGASIPNYWIPLTSLNLSHGVNIKYPNQFVVVIDFVKKTVSFYCNGEHKGSSTNSNMFRYNPLNATIGQRAVLTGNPTKGNIHKIDMFSGAPSLQEVKDDYKQFLNASAIKYPTGDADLPKPTDLSSEETVVVNESITNGDNITSADWNYYSGSGYLFTGGAVYFDNSGTSAFRQMNVDFAQPLVNNIPVTVKFTISGATSSGARIYILNQTGAGAYISLTSYTNGTHTRSFTSSSYAGISFYAYTQSTFTISNISLSQSTYTRTYIPSIKTVLGGQLLDVSGNGKHITLNNLSLTSKGITGNGYGTAINLGLIKGIRLRINPKTTTEYIGDLNATQSIDINSGTIRANNVTSPTIYVNGVLSSTVIAGIFSTIDIVFNTIVYASTFTLNKVGSNYGDIIYEQIKPFAYSVTLTQAKEYNNSFVKTVLIEDFRNHAVGRIANQGTGVFDVVEETTGNAIVPFGTKKLKCITAGTYAIESNVAHGEWRGTIKKNLIYADTNFAIIKNSIKGLLDDTNGYGIRLYPNSGVLYFNKGNGSLFNTAPSYISINVDYEWMIQRLKSEGVFKDIPTLLSSLYENVGYTSFTSNGNNAFAATSNGSGTHKVKSVTDLTLFAGEKYQVEFDLILNSGTAPRVTFQHSSTAFTMCNTVATQSGKNAAILTITTSGDSDLVFYNSSTSTDYSVVVTAIRKVYPAHTFASFIRGGAFGTAAWTLISTASGSGTNPVTDATYTESKYVVADLDAADEFGNLKITDGVKQ